MAETVTLTKTAGGNFYIAVVGVPSYEKPFTTGDFTVNFSLNKIKIVPPIGHFDIMAKSHPPEEWTVGATTGFTTVLEVAEAITALANT